MDNIDRLYERKKFLKIIFNGIAKEEYIRLYQKSNDFSKITFWNDIDDLNNYIENNRFNANTYFNLTTTDGLGGKEENLKYRYCIGLDFDKKMDNSIDHKEILLRFNQLKLWYHVLIDSGHGYHAYIIINKTDDIEKVIKVTKALGNKLGADQKAMLTTQILRMPLTLNLKEEKSKQVNILKMFEKNTIKPYDINLLYKKFCYGKINNTNSKNINFLFTNTKIKPCVKKILERKAIDGSRNEDLQKIIVTLRRVNKSLPEIKCICKEWYNDSEFDDSDFNYQIEYMYNHLTTCSYNCKNCIYAKECWNNTESDFEFDNNEDLIDIEYKIAKKLKDNKKIKIMEGNKLLVLNILKHWEKELTINDIIKHLTYKGKCRLSEKTIRDALKYLVKEEFIIKKIGVKKQSILDSYKLNHIKAKAENIITMSYFPTLICIYGIITPSELRLYTYMRYKHDLALKNNISKGNIFRINQSELANELGTSQKNVSIMINNLIDNKILEIWEVNKNINGFDYYTYRLAK